MLTTALLQTRDAPQHVPVESRCLGKALPVPSCSKLPQKLTADIAEEHECCFEVLR